MVTGVPTEIQQDIDRAVAILKAGGCSAVYLFGSGATHTLRDDSDIDLAVRGCPKEVFFRLFGQLLTELHRSVDLVDLDSTDPFVDMLEQEGTLRRVG